MIPLNHLWLPGLLAAVLVFIGSSLIHMVVKWHDNDYGQLANEDEIRAAIRKGNPEPGQYMLPYCHVEARDKPEARLKYEEGPVGLLTFQANGMPKFGKALGLWFVFNLVLYTAVAGLLAHTLGAGATCGRVFTSAATITFLVHGGGACPAAIWMGKPWRIVAKDVADALFYALLVGAAFGWLWPR
jgi:hypothetical protein